MKFSEYKYERPDLEQYKQSMTELLEEMKQDISPEQELALVHKAFAKQDELSTMAQLVSVRNSVDTRDEFYDAEQKFWNEQQPILQQYDQAFMKQLLESI